MIGTLQEGAATEHFRITQCHVCGQLDRAFKDSCFRCHCRFHLDNCGASVTDRPGHTSYYCQLCYAHDRRFAHDGDAYTYANSQMWEGAAATEHSHRRTYEQRIAADGTAYTYTDFEIWYRAHAAEMWERAAATEHSKSYPSTTVALRALGPFSDTTRHCPTPADLVQKPTDATEHSPWGEASPAHANNTLPVAQDTLEQPLVPMPASSTTSPQATGNLLQCVVCERPLCSTEDLAFFWRANKQGGVEVHLMLKPENKEPEPFIRSSVTQKGAMASWQCACGFKLGDTRAVGVKKAAMTAFKSSSVMLCGQRFTSRRSQWPSVYNQLPFNTIEVRTRDTFSCDKDAVTMPSPM